MGQAGTGLSVPHARLSGTWEVTRETGDGRPTVALREDDAAGVAIAYPYAEGSEGHEGVNKVAAVLNAERGFVLVTASFVSLGAAEDLTADAPTERIGLGGFNDLARTEVIGKLSGGTALLVVVGEASWYPGLLRLFDGPTAARRVCVGRFPRLDDRLLAVERFLAGVDLEEVARRLGSGGSGAPSP